MGMLYWYKGDCVTSTVGMLYWYKGDCVTSTVECYTEIMGQKLVALTFSNTMNIFWNPLFWFSSSYAIESFDWDMSVMSEKRHNRMKQEKNWLTPLIILIGSASEVPVLAVCRM